MTHLFYDLVVVALLLFVVWRGYRQGFVLTLFGFLAIFVAFFGASVLSDLLAQPLANVLQPMIRQQLQQLVQEQASADLSSVIAVEELKQLLTLLQDNAIFRGFAATFQQAVDAGVIQVTTDALGAIAVYVATRLARAILFLVSFVTILVVWSFISHALDLAFRLPVLSSLNRWAGAILGLAKGLVLVYIAAQVLNLGFLSPEAVEQSVLTRFFCEVSPLSLFAAISQ